MRPKSIILLVLALGCGLIASIGISQVMDRRNQTPEPAKMAMEPIYVALKDINVNDQLTPEVLKLEDWPKDKVPPGALAKLEEVEGRRPRTKIYQGEPILEGKLLSHDSPDAASIQIPPGMRSVAVRVDAQSSGGGLLRPGDRVDVQLYLNRNPNLGITEPTTVTVLQDVRVFAVNHLFRRGAENEDGALMAQTVSLLCTPDHAAKLTLASKMGEIRLTMRNPDDDANSHDVTITAADVLNGGKTDRDKESQSAKSDFGSFLDRLKAEKQPEAEPANLAQVPEPPKPWTMILLEGSEPREVEFAEEGRLPQDTGRSLPPGGASFNGQAGFGQPPAQAEEIRPLPEVNSLPDGFPTNLDALDSLGK